MCQEAIKEQQRRAEQQLKAEPKVELKLPEHAKLIEDAKAFLKDTVAEGASEAQLAVDAEQLVAATEAGDGEAQTQIIEQVLMRELSLRGLELPA